MDYRLPSKTHKPVVIAKAFKLIDVISSISRAMGRHKKLDLPLLMAPARDEIKKSHTDTSVCVCKIK